MGTCVSGCCGNQDVDQCIDVTSAPVLPNPEELRKTMEGHKASIKAHGFNSHCMARSLAIFDIDLHGVKSNKTENLVRYFNVCKDSASLVVTLSCFSVWNQNRKVNGFAKVIPAVPITHGEKVRTFFFDDNLGLNGDKVGCEQSPGICNLRDITTGEFVAFGEGDNGYTREHNAKHTIVHSSPKYRTVLVQVNILDAMEDIDFLTKLLVKYSEPGEKIIIFMDVNSTIVSSDAVTNKKDEAVLLGTMFEFIELRPRTPFELQFDGRPAVKVDKPMSFKQLVKAMSKDDPIYYNTFYEKDRCCEFLTQLLQHGAVTWSTRAEELSVQGFTEAFDGYLRTMATSADKDGVTKSWFRLAEVAKASKHSVVLNSFGVDTRKVVVNTVPDESQVLRLIVNFGLWDEKDVKKVEDMYGLKLDAGPPDAGDGPKA